MKSVNDNTPLISVIVPVYKVEPYLDRCVESIANQTYRNLEVILVDDGSPDNCPQICDAWAKKDARIKVIHKENEGAGKARNVALDLAKGDYISLIDSDDYISPYMYEHLLRGMHEGVDIAECELIETSSGDVVLDDGKNSEIREYTTEEALQLHIADRLFKQTPPNKLYSRAAVSDIRFPVGNRIDDEFWTYRIIANARQLVHSSAKMYAYRQHSGSVMHKTFALSRLQAIDAKCQRLEFLMLYYPELVAQARINLWYTCLYMGQMSLKYMSRPDQISAISKILDCRIQYPLTKSDRSCLSFVQKAWASLSDVSFEFTCLVRNIMHIGV